MKMFGMKCKVEGCYQVIELGKECPIHWEEDSPF